MDTHHQPIQPSSHPTHQRPISPFHHANTSINPSSKPSAKLPANRRQSTCHYRLHPSFIIWASLAVMRDGSSSFLSVLALTRPFALLLPCPRKWLTQQRPILNVVRNISLSGLPEYSTGPTNIRELSLQIQQYYEHRLFPATVG